MRPKTQKLRRASLRKKNLVIFGLFIALGALYFVNIVNFPSTDNPTEQVNQLAFNSGEQIKNNVINAPQKIINYGILKTFSPETAYFRIASAAIVVLAVILFFLTFREWISQRVALLSALLFATSSWVLHDARWVSTEPMLLLALPTLLLAGTLLKIKEYDKLLPLTTFLVISLLYTPGFWLFVAAGTAICFKDLKDAWVGQSKKARALWAVAAALPGAPLVYGLIQPESLKAWLGLTDGFNLSRVADNFKQLPEQLFVSGIDNALEWLPGTPVLDIVTTVVFILGAIFVFRGKHYPLRRIVLFGSLLLALITIGFMGPAYISLLLPLVYFFVGFGITYLLEQWLHIFPLNPVARSAGVVIISGLVIMVATYHVARYYYVWPRSDAAAQIFKQ